MINMKQLLVLLFLVVPFSIHGQDKDASMDRRIFIGLSFSSDYCYRSLHQVDTEITDSLWNYVKNIEDSIEKPKFGYTAGINVVYRISKKLDIESGLYFSNKGYKTIPILTYYDWEYPPVVAVNKSSYYYLVIPLKVNYTFLRSKMKIVASLGTSLDIFLKSYVKTTAEDPTESFTTQKRSSSYKYRKIDISPMLGLGVRYDISQKLIVKMEPTFSYGILDIDNKSLTSYQSSHLWKAGVEIGCLIALNKN